MVDGARRVFTSLERWTPAVLAFGACLTVLWAWAPARDAPYQYDDHVTPQGDPASQSLSAFAAAAPGTLRPLTKLTFAVESSLGATTAEARRRTHAVLFCGCVLLVAALSRSAGLSPGASSLAATLWGIHPVHGETVLALAGRSVLLSLLCILASALSLLRGRAALALLLAALAVLARETSVLWAVLCAGLIVEEAVRAPGRNGRRLGAALWVPLCACAVAAALVLASARLQTLLAWSWADTRALDRIGLQVAAIPQGLWLLFASPASFVVDMDFAAAGGARLVRIVLAGALVAAAGVVLFSRRCAPAVRVGAALWLALTLPTQSLVPKLDPLTARTVSASSAALVVLAAAWLAPWAARATARTLRAAGALALVCVLALLPLTRSRARDHQDPVALWRAAALRSTTKTRPLVNVATLLAQRGQWDEAHTWLLEATARAPHDEDIRQRLRAVEVLRAAPGAPAPAEPSGR